MKAKVKLFKSDGTTDLGYPVKLILSHDKKVRRKTFHYSYEYEWNSKAGFPLGGHPDYDKLYDRISEINKKSRTSSFMELYDFDKAFDILLATTESKTESKDFYSFGYERVAALRTQEKFGNATTYKTALDVLKKVYPYLNFKDITSDLLKDFRDTKKREGLKNSSIHNYLRTLRAIYNSAPNSLKDGGNPFKGIFNDIPVKKRRARNRYFDKKQIEELEKLYIPQKALQRAIDLSLLQFYLCGADIMDIYYLKTMDISNGRVFLCRKKLGDKGEEFDILMPEKAKKIIDKYSEPQEDGYLFPWRKSPTAYKTWRKNHNRSLATVKKKLKITLQPRDDKWTTKVMRHTFATLGKYARIEEDLLRELMGHERNDIDTVYKDKYPQEERDAAQGLIIGNE